MKQLAPLRQRATGRRNLFVDARYATQIVGGS